VPVDTAVEQRVEDWLRTQLEENPVVVAVDREPDLHRWYLRMRGEERDFIAVWLTLGDYTLEYETYLMPAPEENEAEVWEYLLRHNRRLFGMSFAIGAEEAVYLIGRMPLQALDEDELDRIIGSSYAYVEAHFRPAMRIGYASKFRG
jgi:hypothetical protein